MKSFPKRIQKLFFGYSFTCKLLLLDRGHKLWLQCSQTKCVKKPRKKLKLSCLSSLLVWYLLWSIYTFVHMYIYYISTTYQKWSSPFHNYLSLLWTLHNGKKVLTKTSGSLKSFHFRYSQFHKTLPKSSLQMPWISVGFYEMGNILEHWSQEFLNRIFLTFCDHIFNFLQFS